ncbi:MAG: Zinc ABC transporter, ATP-binding protein ZnuC [uncultured Thiotrichaceae bacterium]|uniref:Zinc ABC transporter, ATP-binding protein ZnuC n=1 Tax=uncultured Thiotrichaceae bacterium TaxID=298394 RepID=A0A6S6TB54_9GAMM|nr:MAG: Zinc ABC transporter, ATP-binding protein ZnuC [uncultured Thiotrichaceae bacterium]
MTEQLVSLTNIAFSIGERVILHDISLELQRGKILTIIGPNGAGKSTLLRILLGLESNYTGKVGLADGITLGYVPQKVAVDPQIPLSVERFLLLACSTIPESFATTLEQVGVAHLLPQKVTSLSGGEFQRVLLARALLREPDLLVLDEPAQGVDMQGQASLYGLLDELVDEHGFGVLMVSHDLHVVMANTDDVLCLNQHICCSGHPEAVSRHPEYMRLFGDQSTENIGIYTHHHDHEHDLQGNVCPHGHECSKFGDEKHG